MSRPLRLSIVSYLNSVPFLHGLRTAFGEDELEISEDIPSVCAEKLASGSADIGLIPVAVLDQIPAAEIFSEYCIACDGEVGSVLLVSEKPIERIGSVFLDYQSRTSVRLVRILFESAWKKNVRYREAFPGYEEMITGDIAGVIIGDRALTLNGKFKYVYDLGAEWKKITGLPFVFATWATRIPLEKSFVERFNHALKKGLGERNQLAVKFRSENMTEETLIDYWTNKIRFDLGEKEKAGLKEFLNRIRA